MTPREDVPSIHRVAIKGYRSIKEAELTQCRQLNVLIGKNNAGKSNVLNSIALLLLHLKGGSIAAPWKPTGRPADEFYRRDIGEPFSIAVTFGFPPKLNEESAEQTDQGGTTS